MSAEKALTFYAVLYEIAVANDNHSIFLTIFPPYKTEERCRTAIIMIVIDDIPIETHTGAIQGRGIRKRTSIVVRLGGHLIKR